MAGFGRVRVCVRVTRLQFNFYQTTGSATNLTNIPTPEFSDVESCTLSIINLDFFFFLRLAFLCKAEFSELSILPELTERP